MTTGVLMYCFDTPTMEYSKLALKSCELIKKNLNLPITIVTDHDTINYDKLIKYSKIIIDTRGRLKNKKSKKIYII